MPMRYVICPGVFMRIAVLERFQGLWTGRDGIPAKGDLGGGSRSRGLFPSILRHDPRIMPAVTTQ